MPISALIRLGTAKLTNQQIADMALEADRMARFKTKGPRADLVAAAEALTERDALCELLS